MRPNGAPMEAEGLLENAKMPEPVLSEAAEPLSLKNRVLKGAVWMTAEMMGVQATSFAVFATIAHFVTPRDFGLISICFISVQSLQTLVFYDVPTIAVRKQKVENADFTTAFWITIGLAFVAFLLLFELSSPAEKLFRAPGLKAVLQAMSVVLLFMGLSRTHEAWLLRHFHFKSLAIRGLAGAVIGGIVGVVLAAKGFGVDALVAQQVVNSTVTTVLLWLVCPWRPSLNFSRQAAAEIFHFMRRISLNNFVYVINQNFDVFLIAVFFGPVATGFYNIGKRIRLALQLVTGEPIKNIMLPSLAEMQDDHDRLRAGMLRGLSLVCLVCSPVFFGISAISHDVIVLIFGQSWVHAVPILQLLALSGLAIVLLQCNDNIFILKHRPLYCLYVSLTYTILAVAAIFIAERAGIRSVALPFVLPYLVVLPISAWLAGRLTEVPLPALLGAILPGLASATGMFCVLQLAIPHIQTIPLLARVVTLGFLGAAVYFVLLTGLWPRAAKSLLQVILQVVRRRG